MNISFNELILFHQLYQTFSEFFYIHQQDKDTFFLPKGLNLIDKQEIDFSKKNFKIKNNHTVLNIFDDIIYIDDFITKKMIDKRSPFYCYSGEKIFKNALSKFLKQISPTQDLPVIIEKFNTNNTVSSNDFYDLFSQIKDKNITFSIPFILNNFHYLCYRDEFDIKLFIQVFNQLDEDKKMPAIQDWINHKNLESFMNEDYKIIELINTLKESERQNIYKDFFYLHQKEINSHVSSSKYAELFIKNNQLNIDNFDFLTIIKNKIKEPNIQWFLPTHRFIINERIDIKSICLKMMNPFIEIQNLESWIHTVLESSSQHHHFEYVIKKNHQELEINITSNFDNQYTSAHLAKDLDILKSFVFDTNIQPSLEKFKYYYDQNKILETISIQAMINKKHKI